MCWIGLSPQVGPPRADFLERLEAVVAQRRPEIDALMAVEKRLSTHGLAAEGAAVSVQHRSSALAAVSMAPGLLFDQRSGTGIFGLTSFSALEDLAPMVTRRHQTMSHFGFAPEELFVFARLLGGRGINRFVPIGEALASSRSGTATTSCTNSARPCFRSPACPAAPGTAPRCVVELSE